MPSYRSLSSRLSPCSSYAVHEPTQSNDQTQQLDFEAAMTGWHPEAVAFCASDRSPKGWGRPRRLETLRSAIRQPLAKV